MTTQTASGPSISSSERIAEELARLLSDTYTLYLKTHGYHWNVSGPQFHSLHMLFEEQYLEMRDSVDEIAERIRALGPLAPGSYRQMSRLTNIEEDETAPEAMEMVRRLAADHETLLSTARRALHVAEDAADVGTVDLATRRIAVHEKAAWMLRATMGGHRS